MWRALQNASRLALASMAFTMAFFLTPRSWITDARPPASSNVQQVPVDTLEDSDSCLWCDKPEATPCADQPGKWFSPDAPTRSRDGECPEDERGESGPNA